MYEKKRYICIDKVNSCGNSRVYAALKFDSAHIRHTNIKHNTAKLITVVFFQKSERRGVALRCPPFSFN